MPGSVFEEHLFVTFCKKRMKMFLLCARIKCREPDNNQSIHNKDFYSRKALQLMIYPKTNYM